MSARLSVWIVVIAVLLTSSMQSASAAASLCESLFEANGIGVLAQTKVLPHDLASRARVAREIQNSRKASSFYMAEFKRESDAFKKANREKIVEIDWLCIGGGPQCAAASLVLGRTGLKTIVIEKTQLVAKTFAEKDFFINSTETHDLSMHEFPGGVGRLSDHIAGVYAHSTNLAAHIQQQQYASGVPVVLETTMTRSKPVFENGRVVAVEVMTNEGITFRAKNVIAGTGLGSIGTKVQDPAYRAAFEKAHAQHLAQPDKLLPIMSTDALLKAVKNARESGNSLRVPRRLIVIGDGDGSRICLEGLRSKGVVVPKDVSIVWIGNDYQKPEHYLTSRQGDDRYIQDILPFYQAGQITGKPGHVQDWSLNADGSMRVVSKTSESEILHETVGDLIIDATGYDPVVPRMLESLGAERTLVDVKGSLPALGLESTVLARQAVLPDGQLLPVYPVGPAAGILATAGERAGLRNGNGVSIFNNVPRTSKAISQLLGVNPFKNTQGFRESRGPTISAEKMIEAAVNRRQEQRRTSRESALPRENDARLELRLKHVAHPISLAA